MTGEPTEQDVKALADLVEAHDSLPGEPLWRCACGWGPDAVWYDDSARYDLYLNHVSREMLAALPETDVLAQARAEALDEYADHIMAEVAVWDERVYPNRWSNAREKANAARDRAAALREPAP